MSLNDRLAPKLREQKRKRGTDLDAVSRASQPTSKRRKKGSEKRRRRETPSSFWDNLSRQWLTRRALREFDRRTIPRKILLQPQGIEPIAQDISRLKRFARHGGPNLENLRSFPEPPLTSEAAPMSSRQSSSQQTKSEKTRASSKTSLTKNNERRISAYDPAFQQHLEDHGIILNSKAGKPSNWDEILGKLDNPRLSLSPSRFTAADFEAFRSRNEDATSEAGVMSKVFPLIMGDPDPDTQSQQNIPFNNLAALTDGSLSDAQPDFYDGTKPDKENRQLREELGPFIVPSTNTSRPCLPNFFAEGKGPDGRPAIAKLQACYDSALGARGIHEVRSYENADNVFDNKAYTLASTYAGGAALGLLTLYATHPISSGDTESPMEYGMNQLGSFALTHNVETFRQGAAALRNARDWAKEKRDEVIREANERLHLHTLETSNAQDPQASTVTQQESDTSPDKLSQEAPILTSFTSATSSDAPSARRLQSSSKRRRPTEQAERSKRRSKRGTKKEHTWV